MRYLCGDGHVAIEVEATSAEEAAQKYVNSYRGERTDTAWVCVSVQEVGADGEAIGLRAEVVGGIEAFRRAHT